jgi:hypothetical protein
MITLPDKQSDEGVETRVLLAECPGPSSASYTLSLATETMTLMDAVLWNRFGNPGPFGARGAKTLADVVRARGQFRGFESYPNYNPGIRQNIQGALNIANNSKDPRSSDFVDFVNKAIEIAKSARFSDPSPGTLVAWRTASSGSPGKGFLFYKTVLGNSFYYQ